MNIDLVVFDFDGTLADTRHAIVATMQETLAALNLPERSDAECAATIGLPLQDCFRQLVPQLDAAGIEQCTDVYRRIFEVNKLRYKPVLFPQVKDTLVWLHERGIRMTVASSRTSSSLLNLLDALLIAHYFDYIVGSEDVVRAKPDPAPVFQTLRKTGAEAAHTLVVGDMTVDILMGARAGCKTCGVTYGNGSRPELEAAGADFVIDSMDVLRTLCKPSSETA